MSIVGRPCWRGCLEGSDGTSICGVDERALSQHGATALAVAASGGHKDTVELLLDRGADLEAKNGVS